MCNFVAYSKDWHLEHSHWNCPHETHDFTDDKSKLALALAWCCQASSHYLDQYWQNSMSPYSFTRAHELIISDISIFMRYRKGTYIFYIAPNNSDSKMVNCLIRSPHLSCQVIMSRQISIFQEKSSTLLLSRVLKNDLLCIWRWFDDACHILPYRRCRQFYVCFARSCSSRPGYNFFSDK